MKLIYRFLFLIFFTPTILFLSLISKKIRAGSLQKFGFYNFKCKDETLWIHAVSVGEVMAIADFVTQNKDLNIVLTTSTPQGQELAQKKLGDICNKICYFPYDYTFSIKQAIKAINPRMVMIVETEIWPNFASIINKPLIIANGRISDSTFKSYKYLSFFFKEVFKNFSTILAQSDEDAQKFIKIGADKNIVRTMGNIKFDIKCPQKTHEKPPYPIIIAGSTHQGEEEIILKAYNSLKNKITDLKLIIAPRHLERVNCVCSFLDGMNFALKTKGGNFKENDIVVLDTTGELASLYSICDVAFIGGSFNNTGGHNPLEATIWGKPVISGTNIKNFKVVYRELIAENCAIIVQDAISLQRELEKALFDNDLSKNCIRVIEKNQGATAFLSNYIKEQLHGN